MLQTTCVKRAIVWPQMMLKDVWQVEHGKQSSSEIDLRVQGAPQKWSILEDRHTSTGRSTQAFFSLRAVQHSCFTFQVSSNAPALAQGLMNQVRK